LVYSPNKIDPSFEEDLQQVMRVGNIDRILRDSRSYTPTEEGSEPESESHLYKSTLASEFYLINLTFQQTMQHMISSLPKAVTFFI